MFKEKAFNIKVMHLTILYSKVENNSLLKVTDALYEGYLVAVAIATQEYGPNTNGEAKLIEMSSI